MKPQQLGEVRNLMSQANQIEKMVGQVSIGTVYQFENKDKADRLGSYLQMMGIGVSVRQHIAGNLNYGVVLSKSQVQDVDAIISKSLLGKEVKTQPSAEVKASFTANTASKTQGVFEEIKTSLSPESSPLIPQLQTLPEGDSDVEFVYLSEDAIKHEGGACLTPDRSTNADDGYSGFIVSLEKSKWILHICPGGGYADFSKNDFDQLMPLVAQELQRRNIKPDAFVIDERHPGGTLEAFQSWQASKSKASSSPAAVSSKSTTFPPSPSDLLKLNAYFTNGGLRFAVGDNPNYIVYYNSSFKAINVQDGTEFYNKPATQNNKIGFQLNEQGMVTSLFVNGQQTHLSFEQIDKGLQAALTKAVSAVDAHSLITQANLLALQKYFVKGGYEFEVGDYRVWYNKNHQSILIQKTSDFNGSNQSNKISFKLTADGGIEKLFKGSTEVVLPKVLQGSQFEKDLPYIESDFRYALGLAIAHALPSV